MLSRRLEGIIDARFLLLSLFILSLAWGDACGRNSQVSSGWTLKFVAKTADSAPTCFCTHFPPAATARPESRGILSSSAHWFMQPQRATVGGNSLQAGCALLRRYGRLIFKFFCEQSSMSDARWLFQYLTPVR
jgi:hypothetical protein